jgi:IclR family transcriptional regulator, KDG regulon repressor
MARVMPAGREVEARRKEQGDASGRASRVVRAASAPAAACGIKSVGKVLDILEYLADAQRPVGASEVARAVSFHVSTAHRLLQTLVTRGYLEQHEALRHYVLGPRLLALSNAYRNNEVLLQAARMELESLRDALGETVHLALYRDGDVIEIATASSRQPVSVMLDAGFLDPPNCSALGKVLLAHLPPDALANFFARKPLTRRTPRSITSKAALLRTLQSVRHSGYALDEEELASDLCCISVPVIDGSSRVVAALSVAMPKSRFSSRRVPDWYRTLRDAADRVGARLPSQPK